MRQKADITSKMVPEIRKNVDHMGNVMEIICFKVQQLINEYCKFSVKRRGGGVLDFTWST